MDGGALSRQAKPATRIMWLKAGLSVFIVFQLSVALLAPNSDHYVGTTLKPFIEPYANFFELTNKWSFFAPEPGPPPVFVEYELLDAKGESIRIARYPEEKNPYFLRDRQNRRIASVEFMMPGEDRVEKVMVPFLCGKNPEAQSIKLWRIAYQIPTMEDVASGKRQIGDDVNLQRQVVSHTYCERKI